MSKMVLIALCLTFAGCKEKKPLVLTKNQIEYLAQAPIEIRAYMDDCLMLRETSIWTRCYERALKASRSEAVVVREGGLTATDIAIGVGAGKIGTKILGF